MTKTVKIDEAQTQLPKLLSLVTAGNEVIIAEGDKPVAKIVPVLPHLQTRIAGLNKGEIWVSDDFDAPLPDQFWMGTL
jgi:antitoxin (DNA-binding transcriptional repressor) of toxin-antitoxin stability system